MHAVELAAVSAGYASRDGDAAAGALRLHRLDLTLHRGELCALIGPNGAGKSTLIRLIAGVLRPSHGTLRLMGEPAAEMSRSARARTVAVVPQQSAVALGFTVRQVVEMGRAPHQGAMMRAGPADRAAVAQALDDCALGALVDRPASALSGGEIKRVHIARALAQSAPVLLLDEAAAHLDMRHAVALYQLVRRQVGERALACLAAMHDLTAAAHWADRVVLLRAGRILADGPADEVMRSEALSEAFDTAIEVGRLADGRRYVLPRDR